MKHIKMFEDFLNETLVLQELEDEFNITLDLYDNGKWLVLSSIIVPKESRGSGTGSGLAHFFDLLLISMNCLCGISAEILGIGLE